MIYLHIDGGDGGNGGDGGRGDGGGGDCAADNCGCDDSAGSPPPDTIITAATTITSPQPLLSPPLSPCTQSMYIHIYIYVYIICVDIYS